MYIGITLIVAHQSFQLDHLVIHVQIFVTSKIPSVKKLWPQNVNYITVLMYAKDWKLSRHFSYYKLIHTLIMYSKFVWSNLVYSVN